MPPRFSVVVPCYNRARSVLPTLRSVQAQSFADFECIVVDDGSADGAALAAVVAGLADPRFRTLRRANGGASAARNTGIAAAGGEFVAFLDSDDLYLPDKLACDHAALTRESGRGGPVFLFSQVIVERGQARRWIKPARGPKTGEPVSEYLACAQGWTQTSTVVVPADLARAVRFDEGLGYGDDTDFAIRMERAGARFVMHPRPLVVFSDAVTEGRLSGQRDHAALLHWLERMEGVMTPRAWHAYRGFHLARIVARDDRRRALGLYLAAVLRGAMPPALAAKALLQVLLPVTAYRRLMDMGLRLVRGRG
ncbi:MAG: hypothetical protein RIR62_3356 [Pseudomonadota bacterium]